MTQPFEYYKPATRAEALDLLARPGNLPLIIHPKPTAPRQAGARAFVDLGLLGLDYIRAGADGSVHIGALATLQAMVETPILHSGTRLLLSRAAGLAAGPGIRNLSGLWGVLGAHSGPPEVLLALLALEAQVILLGAGENQRPLSIQEFNAKSPGSLQKGELVLEAVLPVAIPGGWALERVARTPRDEAIVAAAAAVEIKAGKVSKVTLALAGANPRPIRLPAVEALLTGTTLDAQTIRSAAEAVAAQADPTGDFRGSAEYRGAMSGLVVRRALEQAREQATHQEAEA